MSISTKLWICEICGYELPEQSDLLKICPNCNALGHFVKSKKYFIVRKRMVNLKTSLFTVNTDVPIKIFNTERKAKNFIKKVDNNYKFTIIWILEDKLNEYINKGVPYDNK
jgi:hypothetical protein